MPAIDGGNTLKRWREEAHRAVAEDIQVCQPAGLGAWIATSGSAPHVAYEVEATDTIAHGCGRLDGLNDDPVCKLRSAFYLLIGVLVLGGGPEEDPPASAAPVGCPDCNGCGVIFSRALERDGWPYPACARCAGHGIKE